MPSSFDPGVDDDELWVPIAFTPDQLAMHDGHFLELYGVLAPGATIEAANAELSSIAAGLERDFPADNRQRGAGAESLVDRIVGPYRLRLLVLLGAVTLVLLIACGYVANLLIARLLARSRELALRTSLGAGRWRLVRQILVESLLLSALGAAVGLLLAHLALPGLLAAAPEGVPRLSRARLDTPVLAFAIGLTAASTLLVGLLPAWQATGSRMTVWLADTRAARGGALRSWVRQALVAGEAALVIVLLMGASLLTRSAINLHRVPVGFDAGGVLSGRVSLPAADYNVTTMSQRLRDTMAQARFNTMLMSLLGAMGLLLGAVGIYSLIAWTVVERTHEIGIRMALGARASVVVKLLVGEGLRPVIGGLASGLLAGVAVGRMVEGQLFSSTCGPTIRCRSRPSRCSCSS